jgi:hypothetical protein
MVEFLPLIQWKGKLKKTVVYLNTTYQHLSRQTEENRERYSQSNQSLGRFSNLVPPEYEAGTRPSFPRLH